MREVPVTREGLERLQAELQELKEERRPAIIAALAEARSHGDLRENAGYDAAKHDMAMTEKRISDLEALLRQALTSCRRRGSEGDPSTVAVLDSLGWVLGQKGDYAAAEPLLREALSMTRRLLGDEHPDAGAIMIDLAALLSATHDDSAAEPLIRSALTIYRRSLPEGDWQIINAESVLGGVLTGLGRYAEAEPLLLNAYPILQEQRGEHSACTRDTLRRLVTLYDAWGKPEKAAEYRALLP